MSATGVRTGAGPRRGRRLRWLIIGVVLIVVLLAALAGGVSWHYASVLLTPERGVPDFPDTVLASGPGEVTLTRSAATARAGVWGLRWAGGAGRDATLSAVLGPIRWSDERSVTRELTGSPPGPGTPVLIDAGAYRPDPGALDVAYRDVVVPTDLGPTAAWFVPGTSSTWVVAVHGRGGDRTEVLRILPTLRTAGLPVLAIGYRNDVDAPASPDGYYHLGDTEWSEVAAAVRYARAHGAARIVLYAWSMGGAITGAFLDRAPEAADVVGIVWDSPVLDWRATLRLQAANRSLPEALAGVAAMVTSWRIGIDFDRFDLLAHPPARHPPLLLITGAEDGAVPVGPARSLAAAPPAGWDVRYLEVPRAGHTEAWNVDRAAYERAVTAFLAVMAG